MLLPNKLPNITFPIFYCCFHLRLGFQDVWTIDLFFSQLNCLFNTESHKTPVQHNGILIFMHYQCHLPYRSPAIPESCHAGVLPCRGPAMPESCHAGVLPCWSPAMPESCHVGVLPCQGPAMPESCHAGVLPCRSAAMPASCRARVLPCRSPAMRESCHAEVWMRCTAP